MQNVNLDENDLLKNISIARFKTYSESLNDYLYNIKLSESFYPALSILEVTLRNRISNAIEKYICKNWLLNECKERKILKPEEHKNLIKAKDKIEKHNKKITNDRLISELTFGFWVYLFTKSYKPKLWDKRGFFEDVFPNYVPDKNLRDISPIKDDLFAILKLRNRIFHHENIINHNTERQYQAILNIIHLLSTDMEKVLKNTSRFDEIIKQKP